MTTQATVARPTRHHRRAVLAAVALGVLLLGAAGFHLTGGRWYVVRTPSMGTSAPVGTLVLTRPTTVSHLHVGQVIAFHPPTARAETYTHRIVEITAQGVRTRGDINGASDPWVVTDRDLIGRAVVVAPGVGWLVRALPLLLAGGLLLWALTRTFVRREWRGPFRMVGAAVLVSAAAAILRPFVSVVYLAVTPSEGTSTTFSLVSTGLLPVRVKARTGHGTGSPLDLGRAGRTGAVELTGHPRAGRFEMATHLHLTPWQWVLAAVVCATPLLWTLIVGYRPPHVARHRSLDAVAA